MGTSTLYNPLKQKREQQPARTGQVYEWSETSTVLARITANNTRRVRERERERVKEQPLHVLVSVNTYRSGSLEVTPREMFVQKKDT